MNTELPPGFKPAERIRVASNSFEGATALFSVDGQYPLLLSDADGLRCWLKAPAGMKQWIRIVEANESKHPAVVVTSHPKSLVVRVRELTVLTAILGDRGVTVVKLDLRPLGLNVYVENSILHVGSTRLSQNTFKNVKVGIALSD